MRTAFKEWAVVVDALGRGDQILILRKGGISEGRGGFTVAHPRFLLFPTLFHQQRESVIPSAQEHFDLLASGFPPSDRIRIEFVSEVVAWRRFDSFASVQRLRGQHIWRDEVLAERFDWGKEKNVHALAVRVHRLPQPFERPMRKSYSGCKSWIELDQDIAIEGASPVLSDEEFGRRISQFTTALEPVTAT